MSPPLSARPYLYIHAGGAAMWRAIALSMALRAKPSGVDADVANVLCSLLCRLEVLEERQSLGFLGFAGVM